MGFLQAKRGERVSYMGLNRKVINEVQKRLDEIQTEATRLMVFAHSAPDAALGARLKKSAKVIFKRTMAIESCLQLRKPTKSDRRRGPQG